MVNGQRYKLDLNTNKAYVLKFNGLQVNSLDFSTQYSYGQLLDNLWSNIRQYMMNLTLQTLMSNSADDGKVAFAPEHPLGLYLDMFTD